MIHPRVVLVVLLVCSSVSVWSLSSNHHNLRQFNAGQDSYYAANGGTNSGSQYKGKGCENPSADAMKNAVVRCVSSGCQVKCKRGYSMAGSRSLHLSCDLSTGALTYSDQPWDVSLPPCLPKCKNVCPYGTMCVAPNKCDAPTEQDFVAVCNPPCENGGSCIIDDICNCPQGYSGFTCDQHRCAIPDLEPSNADFGASNEITMMEVECNVGYKMKEGVSSKAFFCHHGQWLAETDKTVYEDVDVNCYA